MLLDRAMYFNTSDVNLENNYLIDSCRDEAHQNMMI